MIEGVSSVTIQTDTLPTPPLRGLRLSSIPSRGIAKGFYAPDFPKHVREPHRGFMALDNPCLHLIQFGSFGISRGFQ